jgi:hypothetical protein
VPKNSYEQERVDDVELISVLLKKGRNSDASRILTLKDIGNVDNNDGPDAWKNTNGSDFVANANDIIEWDGSNWHIIMDSTDSTNGINQKNLTTGIIYKWNGEQWLQAYEGEYPVGSWEIYLDA